MPKVQGGGAKLPQLGSTGIDGQQVSERERTVPQYCPPKHVSSSITSWKIDGETVDDSFWGSKITADGDCSHEIKTRLLLGRKVMTNLDSILKSQQRSI